MVNDLLDQEGPWQPVTDPGELLHELELMDNAVRDLKMAGSFDDQHIGLVWKTALNRQPICMVINPSERNAIGRFLLARHPTMGPFSISVLPLETCLIVGVVSLRLSP